MRLADIRKKYKVQVVDNKVLIYSLTEKGRFVNKYLCCVEPYKTHYRVVDDSRDNEYVNTMEELEVQINTYLSELKYDSDYFIPTLRKGCAEEFYFHDLMLSHGFKLSGDIYFLEMKSSITGVIATKLVIRAIGLDDRYDDYSGNNTDEITIKMYNIKPADWFIGTWTEVKCDRNMDSIKKCITSLLKGYFLDSSIDNIHQLSKVYSNGSDLEEILTTVISCYDSEPNNKEELKKRLLEMAESL